MPRGRGSRINPDSRYLDETRETVDDGWPLSSPDEPTKTELRVDTARRIITFNDSPDVPVDRSINPYRGCEHGCTYCFARPTHARLDLSPGLDFETILYHKPGSPALLRRELAARRYRPAPLALGINTDAYQPVERRLRLTRSLLEVLAECRHPVSIVTKSALVERDIDLLSGMAARNLAEVALSITTLDPDLARRMEPRAASPSRRLETVRKLRDAGIPVTVLIAPVIPVLTDEELENIMQAAMDAGALEVGYILLRLPMEVSDLFRDWLEVHRPDAAKHVMSRLREMRGGKDYDSGFGRRLKGTGIYAELVRRRFELQHRRLGFPGMPALDNSLFEPPADPDQRQLGLFQ